MKRPRGVRHCLSIQRPGAQPGRVVLTSPMVAGGSRADGVYLAGAQPAAVRLVPRPPGVVVEATSPGVRACGRPIPPGQRRLVRPGEQAEVQGHALRVERAAPEGGETRVAAGALLLDAAAGAEPVHGPHLVVLTGPSAGDRHPLTDGRTIGRGRSAGIRIHDPRASRVHARVRLSPGGTFLEDLRSKNGLRVNGIRVEGRPLRIRTCDEILVGDTALALEEPGAPSGELPATAPASARRGALPARVAAALLLALSAAALALAGS